MNHDLLNSLLQLSLILLFSLAILLYFGTGLVTSSRKYKKVWPHYRYVFWVSGVVSAAIALVGPVAARAHTDFVSHMFGHLFLGMLAPLFFVLSAPMTLLFRTITVKRARSISGILKSWPIRIVSHPIVASILNIGGLWVLYTTNLYAEMAEHTLLHVAVHLHVFLAGYLFTASIIYIDPIPHRFSFIFRTIVFIFALAGHQILSKYIYANPPHSVPTIQAEMGSMLMYYGGDLIDLIIIILLCSHWFKATRPRNLVSKV